MKKELLLKVGMLVGGLLVVSAIGLMFMPIPAPQSRVEQTIPDEKLPQ